MSETFEPLDVSTIPEKSMARATVLNGKYIDASGNIQAIEDGRVLRLSAENPWATVEIGHQWPDGHTGPRWSQHNTGGVMVAYAPVPDEVLQQLGFDKRTDLNGIAVSLVAELRQNLSEKSYVLCVPGGFSDDNESAEAAGEREFIEETGVAATIAAKKRRMNAPEIIDNRNFGNLRNGHGNDIIVADTPIDFADLTRTKPGHEAIGHAVPDTPIWHHKTLRGRKGEQVYFVLPEDLLQVTPDSLAYPAVLAAMVHNRQRLNGLLED